MASAFQVDFTREYFGDWAETLHRDQSLIVPQKRQLRPLMKAARLADAESLDASNLAAVQVTQAPAFAQELEGFTRSKESARKKLDRMLRVYKNTRQALEEHEDIVQVVLDATAGPQKDLEHKVVSYLTLGAAPTRLGHKIEIPGKDAEDRPLMTLLRLIRLIAEHEMDEKFGLPWLVDVNTPEAIRAKTWETKAGNAGDTVGSALGRAVAVGMATIVNPFVKLPDELTLGVSFFTGVVARKGAEYQMHKYLETDPDLPE